MADYDNTNKGVLFTNKRKTKDTHPTHSGTINVNGTEFWLSAWVNTSKSSGERFFSLSVTPKDSVGSNAPPGAVHGIDDDIPF